MKSLCIYFFYTLSMISMMRSGIDPNAQAAAPAVSYEQQMESAGAYGDFGDIQVMVGDDWVSIYGEDEKRSLQSTRNAFGHNTYDVDLPTVFEGKEEKMKIPEVANGIKNKIEKQTEELKKSLQK